MVLLSEVVRWGGDVWLTGVVVPEVPESVHQPILTWFEGILLALTIVAIGMYVVPLARAMWPWSKPREASESKGRWWIAAFVTFPVFIFALWWVDGAVDRHYDELRQERRDAVDVIGAQALADVEARYNLVATEETRDDGLSNFVDTASTYRQDRERQEEATFIESDGTEVLCLMTLSPPAEGREITLECPSPLEPRDPNKPAPEFPPPAD